MKTLILSILGIAILQQANAQQGDNYYQKAKEYYDNKQPREALYYLRKFIALDATKAETFKWRGNCYLDLNQLDSAKLDYETALRLAPTMSEVYYNLAGLYVEKKEFAEAERNLRIYISKKPDDVSGLIRMAYIKRNLNPDSSFYYFQKAYQKDTTDLEMIDLLTVEYFYQGSYDKAIALALKSRAANLHNQDVVEILAYSKLALRQYEEAMHWADTLINKDPKPLHYYVLKSKSEILLHTDPTVLQQAGLQNRFKDISSYETSSLDQLVSDSQSKYAYTKLLSKFRSGETLGLDEYFMLYYGFTMDDRYSPYGHSSDKLRENEKDENFEAVIKECKELLKKDEFSPRTYEYLAIAQFKLGDKEFAQNFKHYIGIVQGILASGTGESAKEAYIVNCPSHEYDILGYLGLNSTMQSLVKHDGHDFDILKAKLEDDTEKDIYFNIDKPFGSLGKMFDKTTSPKTEKKRKNKKG